MTFETLPATLEIPQPDENEWKGWLVLEKTVDHVTIHRDYQKPDGERKSWQDEGIAIRIEDVPSVIEWLQAMVTGSTSDE
jgi:hypothetical protein